MTILRWTGLTEAERDDFLGEGGTGVIAFVSAQDEPPVAFPVSYGYAADKGDLYFRLSFPEGTNKDVLVENPVTFVTYGESDSGWRSVVARGSLEELSHLQTDSAAVQAMWAVSIPTVDMFDRPREEIPFVDFRLDTDEMTARREVR